MSTVVLHGYYGFGNAGDEALLHAIASDLRRVRPDVRLVVLSADPARTARTHGLAAVPRLRPWSVAAALSGADLFVLGGGTLLQDTTSVRSLAYYAAVTRLAKRMGCRVMLYANGLGPIGSPSGRRLARWALNAADLITLRDRDSLGLLRALCGDDAQATVTADAALSLEWPAAGGLEPGRTLGALCLEPRRYAVYAFRPWPGLEARRDDLAFAARTLAEERGLTPLFLAMHPHHDLALARDLAARAGPSARAAAPDPADTTAFLAILAEAGLIVSMRLHALVLAAAAGTAAVAVSYDPKVDAAALELGMPSLGRVEALPPLEALLPRLRDAVAGIPASTEALRSRVPELRARARENARMAAELLPG